MRAPFLVASLLLTACGSIVPTTASRLAAVDPVSADPAAISVEMVLPQGLGVMPQGAKLAVVADRADTGQRSAGEYTLAGRRNENGRLRLSVAAEDQSRLRQQQALVRAWQEEAPNDTKGQLSVSLSGCLIGNGPSDDAVVSVFVQLEPEGPVLPLLRDVPLARALTTSEINGLGPCPT